jgi:predicted metal-binding protein
LNRYVSLAKDLEMENAILITPADIHFDIRAILKCRWGCDDTLTDTNPRCCARGTTFRERVDMIRSYENVLLLHSHDQRQLGVAVLETERAAFLDGYYFASAIRCCSLCKECSVLTGGTCPTPKKIRPCGEMFGIDVFKTVTALGLPISVLAEKHDIQNRYGFVLID